MNKEELLGIIRREYSSDADRKKLEELSNYVQILNPYIQSSNDTFTYYKLMSILFDVIDGDCISDFLNGRREKGVNLSRARNILSEGMSEMEKMTSNRANGISKMEAMHQ